MYSLRHISAITFLLSVIALAQSSSQTNAPIAAFNVSKPAAAQASDTQAKVAANYGKLPLSFEANHGQTDPQVKFLSRTAAYSLFLTGDEAVLTLNTKKSTKLNAKPNTRPSTKLGANPSATPILPPDAAQSFVSRQDFVSGHRFSDAASLSKSNAPSGADRITHVLRMKLQNANSAAKVTGIDEQSATTNYFIGNDPAKWRTNVHTYAKIKYENIYNGIDLVYYGNQRQLEYDFIVAPGANPRNIAFNITGTSQIRQDAHGDLVFKMNAKIGDQEIRWHKPVVYQEKNGARHEIAGRYVITNKHRVGFELAKYDVTKPLYIDPLIYSTYLGGSGADQGNGIAVDSAGNAYITGQTASTDFPTKNPLQPANGGSSTAFVTKINAAGSALVYSTYLGGSGGDYGFGIAVDSKGNAYVTGYTESTNFPTKNPLQPVFGGSSDAFVTEINPAGSALVYSTYLGGSGLDVGTGIAVDTAGNAYVTGNTASTDFPTKNPFQSTNHGGNPSYDAFVTKINPSGSALVYSTYLGGSGDDNGGSIAVDGAGNAYATGTTYSTDFPTKNPLQPNNGGKADIFVTKFDPTGSALVYSTYLGDAQNDYGNGIAADSAGNAYIASTWYSDFCDHRTGRCSFNAQVGKINPTGSAFVYGAVIGNSNYAASNGIAVDSSGNAYIVGTTNYDRTFVERLDPSGTAVGSPTYLRGTGGSTGYGIAVDGSKNAYVTGTTSSTNFPTKNPLQPANAGGYDAFVSKIDMRIVTTTTLTSSPNPSTQGQLVTFTAVVGSGSGTPPDGETVSFVKGKTVLGTGTLSGGTATFITSSLPAGTNLIQAVYGGDPNFTDSKSKQVKQVVN
jgi:hypothetical protein